MAGLLAVGGAAIRSAIAACHLAGLRPAMRQLFLAIPRPVGPSLPIQTGVREKTSVTSDDQHRYEVPHGGIVARSLQPILQSLEA